MNGKLAIVQWLLEGARVDVNVSNNFGTTALMESAIQGHQEIIKCLLQYGADVNLLANVIILCYFVILDRSLHRQFFRMVFLPINALKQTK